MQHLRVVSVRSRLSDDTETAVESGAAESIKAESADADQASPAIVDQRKIVTQVHAAPQQHGSDEREEELLGAAAKTPPLRTLSLPKRVGFLGLVAVIMWWTWPRADSPLNAAIGLLRDEPQAQQVVSLAVVNPANVAYAASAPLPTTTPVEAAQPTPDAFPTIVVVTPTSAQPQPAVPVRGETVSLQGEAAINAAASSDDPPAVAQPASMNTTTEQAQDNEQREPSEPNLIILESSASLTETLLSDDEPVLIDLNIPNAAELDAMPAVQPLAAEDSASSAAVELLLIPSPTPTYTPPPASVTLAEANIPRVNIVPAVGVEFTATPEPPTPTPTVTPTPSPTPISVGPGRLWSTFVPRPAADNDHFWLGNPFEDFAANRYASPNYQFGSTAGNRYRPHHGLDLSNPLNTPVQAGVAGEVIHAGLDDPDILGPYANFYGKAVVIRLDQRLPVAGGEMDVFVLYGHLNEVRVAVGQRVKPEDIVGLVGMTGIAIGPHLHVEIRLGANTYAHTVNPYLWLKPAQGNGAVAVRALTADGRTWAGAKVSIARFEGGKAVWARQVETYLDTEQIGPDPAWGENGAMGDVPAGHYYLIANVAGESIRAEFDVFPGQTTFVEIRTQQ